MADKDKEQAQDQQARPATTQDLPPNHPNDRTLTTLTQEEPPDEDAQAAAIADRIGGVHVASRERGRKR